MRGLHCSTTVDDECHERETSLAGYTWCKSWKGYTMYGTWIYGVWKERATLSTTKSTIVIRILGFFVSRPPRKIVTRGHGVFVEQAFCLSWEDTTNVCARVRPLMWPLHAPIRTKEFAKGSEAMPRNSACSRIVYDVSVYIAFSWGCLHMPGRVRVITNRREATQEHQSHLLLKRGACEWP